MSIGSFPESLSQGIPAGIILAGSLGVNNRWTDNGLVSPVAKDRFSDAGGLGFESHAGRVTGESTPSLWMDKRPAIKGLLPQSTTQGIPSGPRRLLRVKRAKTNDEETWGA